MNLAFPVLTAALLDLEADRKLGHTLCDPDYLPTDGFTRSTWSLRSVCSWPGASVLSFYVERVAQLAHGGPVMVDDQWGSGNSLK